MELKITMLDMLVRYRGCRFEIHVFIGNVVFNIYIDLLLVHAECLIWGKSYNYLSHKIQDIKLENIYLLLSLFLYFSCILLTVLT